MTLAPERSAAPLRALPGIAVAPRQRLRGSLACLGPAFVAGIAYVDPGNFATNIQAGGQFGYRLLWVVVAATGVAALMQYLAAKLGLASGRGLAQVGRERWGRPLATALWLQAELVAIATDLAEVVGGALALQLLFGLPTVVGAGITAAVAMILLRLHDRGGRTFELAVLVLLGVIAIGFCWCVLGAGPHVAAVAGGLVPSFAGSNSVVLATAIVGATVMPHAIYVHSALVAERSGVRAEVGVGRALRLQRLDIGAALGTAGLVNLAMVVGSAALPGSTGIVQFHHRVASAIGVGAALAFALALLASGLASSGVGTLAGEIAMAGYVGRHIPRVARRAVTIVPTLAVLGCGVSIGNALLWSQIALALGVPVTLLTLVLATRSPAVMGGWVNRRSTSLVATLGAVAVAAMGGYTMLELVA